MTYARCVSCDCEHYDASDRHGCKFDGTQLCPCAVVEVIEDEKQGEYQQSALQSQVGGTHYKQYKIQPYDFFFKNGIPHHKAAIIRRILRYDHPTGKGKEDLEKIRHEIDLIMELEGWK